MSYLLPPRRRDAPEVEVEDGRAVVSGDGDDPPSHSPSSCPDAASLVNVTALNSVRSPDQVLNVIGEALLHGAAEVDVRFGVCVE